MPACRCVSPAGERLLEKSKDESTSRGLWQSLELASTRQTSVPSEADLTAGAGRLGHWRSTGGNGGGCAMCFGSLLNKLH